VRIGFTLPQFGAQAEQGAEIGRFARAAEELGAAGLWVADRLLAPVEPQYGYAGGAGFPEVFRRALDPLVVLTAAATATTRVRLGTNVLCAPFQPPVLLARTALSIDRISGGRLLLGLGVGWSPEEFAAVGVPLGERGDRLDECLDVLDAWFAGGIVAHEGRFTRLAPAHVDLAAENIPVYLGAFSPRGVRRMRDRSAGWLPTATAGAPLDRIVAMWEGLGRVPAILRVAVAADVPLDTVSTTLDEAAAAGFEEAFVELVHVAHDVDDALGVAARLLERAARPEENP
jgi:probable F420-dependent oxidoreductase